MIGDLDQGHTLMWYMCKYCGSFFKTRGFFYRARKKNVNTILFLSPCIWAILLAKIRQGHFDEKQFGFESFENCWNRDTLYCTKTPILMPIDWLSFCSCYPGTKTVIIVPELSLYYGAAVWHIFTWILPHLLLLLYMMANSEIGFSSISRWYF